MRRFWEKYLAKGLAFLILLVLILGVISAIAVFGGAVMRFFGFQYRSVGSILLFFLLAALLSLPASLFAEALPRALYFRFQCPKGFAVFLYLALDTLATAAGLVIVDYFLDSVSASGTATLAVSFLLALWGVRDALEEKKGE